MIYLDSAATVKPKQEVIDAMMPYFTDKWYNPSALYSKANQIKNDVISAKKEIANYINCSENEIYFTSGGSEANCWAIQGFVNYCKKRKEEVFVITTSIEHKSILECVKNSNVNYFIMDVNKFGFVNIEALRELLVIGYKNKYKTLVSVQHVNNEIGTIQRIKHLANIAHQYGAIFHTDAVQAFGKIETNVSFSNVDLMSVSGHKIGCPKGIGFLYIKDGIQIEPLIYGTQENGMRGGTENIPYIMGFKKAVQLISNRYRPLQPCIDFFNARQRLLDELKNKYNCKQNGAVFVTNRVENIINVTFPDIATESLIYLLDIEDVCISAGSACNAHSNKPSYVLKAIGLSDAECMRTIRLSLTDDFNIQQAEEFLFALDKVIKILKSNVEL